MKFEVQERASNQKSEAKRLRREGSIPAVLYGMEEESKSISIKAAEMEKALRSIEPQLLATTLFDLEMGKKTQKAIIKDVHYHPVSYQILHVDFQVFAEDKPIAVNVPIKLQNMADCAGVKLGGFIRHVIRSLKVRCLGRDLPKEFHLDLLNLKIAEVLRLSDISIPEGVKPVAKMNEVAVVISKKA